MLPVSDAPPSASALPTGTFGDSSRKHEKFRKAEIRNGVLALSLGNQSIMMSTCRKSVSVGGHVPSRQGSRRISCRSVRRIREHLRKIREVAAERSWLCCQGANNTLTSGCLQLNIGNWQVRAPFQDLSALIGPKAV